MKSRKSGAEIFVGDSALRAAYEILLKNAAKGNVLRYLYIRLKAIALSQARSTTCGCICPGSKRK
jgi:hypothetical protein